LTRKEKKRKEKKISFCVQVDTSASTFALQMKERMRLDIFFCFFNHRTLQQFFSLYSSEGSLLT